MGSLVERIDELFEDDTPDPDDTGSLAELAATWDHLKPRLLCVMGAESQLLAAHPPEDVTRLRHVRTDLLRLTHGLSDSGYAISSPGEGTGFVLAVAEKTPDGSCVLLAWFGRDPREEEGSPPPPKLLTAARLAARVVRLARRMSEIESRIHHLQNEQEVMTAFHTRNIGEMLDAKEKQTRQDQEHVSELEHEVRRRSAALKEALRQAEFANDAKSAFLSNVSHELRTPLTAILGYTDLLLESELPTRDTEEYTSIIRRNGKRLLELLGDMLDFSRIESRGIRVERTAIDVRRVVEDVINSLQVRALEKDIHLVAEFENVPAALLSDPTRIRQILLNLIGNSLKFTEKGGVRVVTKTQRVNDQYRLVFEIIDTGIGMTEEQQKSLFQPFTQGDSSATRRFGGIGLGLSIARNLAKLLGGDIVAISEYGAGSTFRATITVGEIQETEEKVGSGDPASSPTPDRIRSEYSEDPELAQVIQEFLDGLPELTARIRSHLESGDLVRVRSLSAVLRLEGGAAGFPALAELGGAIETKCDSGDLDGIRSRLEDLGALLGHLGSRDHSR